MANHPNRNTVTIAKLQSHYVPSDNDFKPGVLCDIERSDGRLIAVADWEKKLIYLTIATGVYNPPRMQQGITEEIGLENIFPNDGHDVFDFICGTYQRRDDMGNEVPYSEYRMKYHDYILGRARAAQKIIDDANYDEDDEVDEAVKAKVRAMLQPYTEERMTALISLY